MASATATLRCRLGGLCTCLATTTSPTISIRHSEVRSHSAKPSALEKQTNIRLTRFLPLKVSFFPPVLLPSTLGHDNTKESSDLSEGSAATANVDNESKSPVALSCGLQSFVATPQEFSSNAKKSLGSVPTSPPCFDRKALSTGSRSLDNSTAASTVSHQSKSTDSRQSQQVNRLESRGEVSSADGATPTSFAFTLSNLPEIGSFSVGLQSKSPALFEDQAAFLLSGHDIATPQTGRHMLVSTGKRTIRTKERQSSVEQREEIVATLHCSHRKERDLASAPHSHASSGLSIGNRPPFHARKDQERKARYSRSEEDSKVEEEMLCLSPKPSESGNEPSLAPSAEPDHESTSLGVAQQEELPSLKADYSGLGKSGHQNDAFHSQRITVHSHEAEKSPIPHLDQSISPQEETEFPLGVGDEDDFDEHEDDNFRTGAQTPAASHKQGAAQKISSRMSVIVHDDQGWDDEISLLGDDGTSRNGARREGVAVNTVTAAGGSIAAYSRRSYSSQFSVFSHRVLHPPLPLCSLQNLERLPPSKHHQNESRRKKDTKKHFSEKKKNDSEPPKKKKQKRKSIIPCALRR